MGGGDSGGGVAGFVLSGEATGGVVGVLGTVAGPPLGGGGDAFGGPRGFPRGPRAAPRGGFPGGGADELEDDGAPR